MKKINVYDAVTDKDFIISSREDVTYPEHLHYGIEIIFVLDGEICATREDEKYTLTKGEGLLFMPYEVHSYETKKSSKVTILVFSSEFIDELNTGDRFTKLKFPISQSVINYASEFTCHENWSVSDIKALIYPLFREFLAVNRITVSENEYSEIVRQTLTYIEQHYGEDIGLSDAAEFIGCHYVYLSRCFSQNTGFPFTVYLNRYRIARSLYLLKNTHDTITDIAYKCGFGSLRSYNRVFKACLNESPKEYRSSKNHKY